MCGDHANRYGRQDVLLCQHNMEPALKDEHVAKTDTVSY